LNLVEEGLDVGLGSGGSRVPRNTWAAWGAGGSGLTGAARVPAATLAAPAPRGAQSVHLPRRNSLGRRLVWTDGTAFSEGHVGLGGAVLHVGALHARAPVRVFYAVVYLHSAGRRGRGLTVFHIIAVFVIISFSVFSIIVFIVRVLRIRLRLWLG